MAFKDRWAQITKGVPTLGKTHDVSIQEEVDNKDIGKGQHGLDFNVMWDSKKRVWYVAQVGTGKTLYESKDEEDAINWGKKNAKIGYVPPKFKKFGIDNAGPTPNSLLARQDLEWSSIVDEMMEKAQSGEETLFTSDLFDICHYMADDSYVVTDKTTGDEYKLYSPQDALARAKTLAENHGILFKSSTATDDKLEEVSEKAEDADTEGEKHDLVDTIKAVQVKRQKATLKERGVAKSFRDAWNGLSKSITDPTDAEQAWSLLRRERKDLEDKQAALELKLEKNDEDRDMTTSQIKDIKERLGEVNKDINSALDTLKRKG